MEGFIKVKFLFFDEEIGEERIESMWTSLLDEWYKIENIPFYVTELAWGDLISVKEKDGELFIDKIEKESGHSTVRIFFYDKTFISKTRQELEKLGCPSEGSENPSLIAIDIPPNVDYKTIVLPYLEQGCKDELWDYEEACLSQ